MVTLAVPESATSAAAICAVRCVASTKVVGRSPPFQRTVMPLAKSAPVTVRVNAALPSGVVVVPRLARVIVGMTGVTTAVAAGPLPLVLCAVTPTVYAVPLVRPVNVAVRAFRLVICCVWGVPPAVGAMLRS